MKKKVLIIALALLALVAGAWLITRDRGPKAQTGVELLKNGGFEEVSGEGLPEAWLPDAYVRLLGVTEFSVAEEAGGNVALITNHEMNDARFSQKVEVVPNTIYRLTGKIKAKAEGGLGANLSIQDVYVFSESLYDTRGDWQQVELYGKTGGRQTEITVFARLGGYSGEAMGEAAFDDISLMAVDKAPSSAFVAQWEKQVSAPAASGETKGAAPAAPVFLVLMALGAAAMYLFARLAEREKTLGQADPKGGGLALALLLAAAGLSRLAVAALVHGFPVDIGCFTGWAGQMARVGPGGFYISDFFSDYPPGYMLVLWPLGLIGQMLGAGVTPVMVKLPALLCDLGIIALLYRTAQKRVGSRAALLLSMLYAFNPLPYLAGSAWGQVDSVPSLLLVIAVLFIMDGKWRYALPVYVVSVLMKPQALMVGPLGLVAFVAGLIWSKDEKRFKDAAIGVGLSLVAAAVIVLPFFNEQTGFAWLFELYGGTMSYYDYATVNATNLYFLFSKNWVKVAEAAPFLLRLTGILTVALSVGLAWGFSKDRKDKHWLIALICVLPALGALLPMSMSAMGVLLMVSVFLLVAWRYIAGRDAANLALLAGVMLVGFSILGTMMHERYLMMAVVLLILAYVLKRDRRVLWLIIAATALCFLNSGVVLDRGIRIGGPEANLLSPELGLESDSGWLEMALSAFSLPVAGYALYLGIVLTKPGAVTIPVAPVKETASIASSPPAVEELNKRHAPVRFDRKDAVVILVVTALYALLAFINLGATKAPQKGWVSDNEVMQATLDLGESREFKILYYGGIHWRKSDFTLEVSQDGQTWTEHPAVMNEGSCFSWMYHKPVREGKNGQEYFGAPLVHSGRYVRVTSPVIGLTLYEVLLRDAATGETLPVKALEETSAPLIDEQGSLDGEPGWFNSMYFDEIYHGRTAFEMLEAIRGQGSGQIYETTHPQLGKLLMTFSLMIFGMVPFGWRFAGALAGVLMLPGMYLLGKQVTRRRGGGMVAMLLMTFDFMHFTQTRIATIDSFVTLFIIYAYFFMFRYISLDYFATPLEKRLPPLFLSGLMMGLAVASKWTGAYAGIGLAVLFFWALARWGRQARAMEKLPEEARQGLPGAVFEYKQRVLITLLWCLLFFVVIPLGIYILSFIPMHMQSPGGFTLQKVIDSNINMYDYHSEPGRGADHFFHTPWYEWPVSAKPMWYYAGGVVDGTASTIIAFGNILIWWGGLVAMVALMAVVLVGLFGKLAGTKRPVFAGNNIWPAVIVLSFLAQYLPWVAVPRGTYIYHYFPSVPFIILALVLWLDAARGRNEKLARIIAISFLAAAGILFVVYFPYLSGVRVSTAWLDALKIFPNWLYY